MSRKLKTGVVGAGVFGSFHVAKHAASGRADFIGVFDPDRERGRSIADQHGAEIFPSFESLLERVDAVTVASPAPTHFPFARAALEAGRHVYVEKPLALSVGEADALIDLAKSRLLVLQVGHQERFILAALGLPRADAAPVNLEFARCGPPTGRGEDVSVVFDLMIHDLDIARFFGFRRPARVSACGSEHETIATLGFDDGRTCSFIASRRDEKRRRFLKATFEDGVIEIDFIRRGVSNSTPADLSRNADDIFADPLARSVDAFFASILDGARTTVDGKAGRGAIEWAAMIDEARSALNAPPLRERRIA